MPRQRQRPSLMGAEPILFSPIHLNVEGGSTDKLLALYRFAQLFFPQLGPGIVQTLLDMERHGERLCARIPPAERRQLISEMRGLSLDFHYALRDAGQKMLEFSIHIVPGDVLERAQQGRIDPGQYAQLRDEIDRLVMKLIEKEVCKRFTGKVEGFLQTFLDQPAAPPLVSQLLDTGWIDGQGRLAEGATIDDLVAGRYREQFEALAPEELLQEGLQIRETISTCFSAGVADADTLLQDARRRHALLEITIQAVDSEEGPS